MDTNKEAQRLKKKLDEKRKRAAADKENDQGHSETESKKHKGNNDAANEDNQVKHEAPSHSGLRRGVFAKSQKWLKLVPITCIMSLWKFLTPRTIKITFI